jgi:regulator of protease activity HflC (stomatin/prohibitin superfamily)
MFAQYIESRPVVPPISGRRLAFVAAFVVGAVLLFAIVVRVTRIEAGHVGIEINLAGTQRGPSDIPIRTGWVFYSPIRSQVIEFPTYVQTVKWTRDIEEGSPTNEEMSFNSREGMQIMADVSLSYSIDPAKVPHFYVKYRVDRLNLFTQGILRDIVRNSLNQVASNYTVEEIYGPKKGAFLAETEKLIQEKIAAVGVMIQQFGFIGAPHVPEMIARSITEKARAVQEAERARNELEVARAEAAKKIAEAQGDATSSVTRARGEAESNRIRQTSITPQLIAWRKLENQRVLVERWNGQLPQVESSNAPILALPTFR